MAMPSYRDDVSVEPALTGTRFNWVDTMANLRRMSHDATSPIAVLEGWSSADDGGGGIFCWNAESREADDGGTIVRPANVAVGDPGRWRRQYSGPLNMRWFGAGLGEDDDDDGPTIQAVIDRVAARGGGTIFFPAGTYHIKAPLVIAAPSIRIIGDGQTTTTIAVHAVSSTVFNLRAASFFHLADIKLTMGARSRPSDGAAIMFTGHAMRPSIQRVYIDRMWQGIACGTDPDTGKGVDTNHQVQEAVIRDVKMDRTLHVGLKMFFALNWRVTSCVIGMLFDDAWNGPGSNHFGVWLDVQAEGCIFDTVFVLGGEHCWRIANSIDPGLRGPSENRFQSCIGDNGTVSCMYISSLHRGIFSNCWCSTQKETSDATVVMDSLDVWGVEWTASQIVFTRGHGIKVLAARSFSVVNSTFSAWNVNPSFGVYSAIIVYPGPPGRARTNFSILGNQFFRDTDFDAFGDPHCNQKTITVTPGTYNRYIITNNMSWSGSNAATLGSGALDPVSDGGTAAGRIVNNNL